MPRLLVQAVVILGLLLHVNTSLVAAESDRGFLTAVQKEWLNSHPTELQVAPEANYPPFSFIGEDVWRGLSADVIKQIEEKLGTRFSIQPPQDLNSILDNAKHGAAGIVTSVAETPERLQYLSFTQPYVSIPTVILVNDNSKTGNWPEAFADKQVAVGKGYGIQRFLEKNYPGIKLTLVPDDQEGLHRLSLGEVDAVIMDVASAYFFIEKEKLTNLHVFGPFDFTYNLSFAVRKDLPILREILVQTLRAIPARDKQTIASNWHINLETSEIMGAGYERLLPHALTIALLLIGIGAAGWFIKLHPPHISRNSALPQITVPGSKRQLHYLVPASIVLLVSLLVLAAIGQELSQRHEKNHRDSFVIETQRVTTKIRERMRAYGHILLSGAGFFAGSGKVEHHEWKAFVEKLDLDKSYRGIQGVGFSLLIPREKLGGHIKDIRKQGFPEYDVRPPGDREVYTSIIYLEPFSGRNLRAFGYDMFSEPIRNEAMARARDLDDLSFSGKVTLVQETSAEIQAGLLAYYPVYKNGAITQTTEQRRAAHIGWVYSPYRMNDLLDPVLANELTATKLEIFDEGTPSRDTLLFDSHRANPIQTATDKESALSSIQTIEIGGRYWTLRYTTLPGYAETSKFQELRNEFLALIVIGLLLIGLTWAFVNTRRKAEIIADAMTDSLRQSEERWKFALEGAGDGVWDWDIAVGQMTFSSRWYEIQGFAEGTIGPSVKDWEELVHPDDLPIMQQVLQAHFDGKTPNFSCEHRVRCENGEYKWILGRGMVVARDAEGKPLRVIGTHTDITERKQAEDSIRQSINEQVAIFESATSGIAFIKDRIIIKGNRTLDRLFGYEPGEQVGLTTRRWYADDEAFQVGGTPYAALAHGEIHQREQQLLRKDGTKFWCRLSGSAIDAKDLSRGTVWMITDVTLERENAEAMQQAKEAAEAANLAKSRFLATMSHEIRTPMNGILGMAQMLLVSQLEDYKRQDYARTILNSGQTLLTLLNDILDFSKVEAGKIQLESTAFDPVQIIQETRALFAETASGKDLAIVTSEFHAAGQRYLGDPYRLRQMISNLVSNAIKFTSEGHISIAAHELRHDGQSATLEFSVTDTGIGIADDHRQLLFKPFSQGDSSTTRQYGGTGLGLSIVNSLAKLMGGEAGVESEPGHGSRFWFRIQTSLVEAGQDSRHVERSKLPGSSVESHLVGRVLVAEDDATNRKVAQALLSKIGLTATFAEDGQQVLDAITQGDNSDLILMDIHMPVMDGYLATEKIRQWEAENSHPRRPIIALTADAFEEDRKHCLAVGMDDFLAKPIAIDTLREVLGKWLPAESKVSSPSVAAEKPLDVTRIAEILRELEPMLEHSQFDAISRFRELLQVVAGTHVADEIAEAGRLLSEFRFTETRDRLNRMAAKNGWNKAS